MTDIAVMTRLIHLRQRPARTVNTITQKSQQSLHLCVYSDTLILNKPLTKHTNTHNGSPVLPFCQHRMTFTFSSERGHFIYLMEIEFCCQRRPGAIISVGSQPLSLQTSSTVTGYSYQECLRDPNLDRRYKDNKVYLHMREIHLI